MIVDVSCSSSTLAAIVSAMQKIISLIQIIVPILLMISLAMNIFKMMKTPDDKKTPKKILNSIIAAVLVFFIPMFINLVFGLMRNSNSFTSCWNNTKNPGAATDYVDPYKEEKKSGFIPNSDDYEKGEKKKSGGGVPLDTKEGYHKHVMGNMTYYVWLPPKATTNMPLLLWLHGDNGRVEWVTNNHIGETAYKAGIPIIMVSPFVEGMGTATPGWYEGGLLPQVKQIVDEVCKTYSCDTSNINIGGHSRGAIGTWMMVSSNPDYFHAASPVSCCSSGLKASSFSGMKVWAFRGSGKGSGDNNDDIYGGCMQSDINKVKQYAKEVKYTIQPNTTHGEAMNKLQFSEEYVRFMFEK